MQQQICKPEDIGVTVVDLKHHIDGRGDLIELWSEAWLSENWPSGAFSVPNLQIPKHIYQSFTDPGVVKAWHYHSVHTDQLVFTSGKMQLLLASIDTTNTITKYASIITGYACPKLVIIPPRIYHGWKNICNNTTSVINLQTHVYSPNDEHRTAWDAMGKGLWEPVNG